MTPTRIKRISQASDFGPAARALFEAISVGGEPPLDDEELTELGALIAKLGRRKDNRFLWALALVSDPHDTLTSLGREEVEDAEAMNRSDALLYLDHAGVVGSQKVRELLQDKDPEVVASAATILGKSDPKAMLRALIGLYPAESHEMHDMIEMRVLEEGQRSELELLELRARELDGDRRSCVLQLLEQLRDRLADGQSQ